jgi:hypothetical protein
MENFDQAVLNRILADSKSIAGEISWAADDDHTPTVEFRADVESPSDDPLVVIGKLNRPAAKLSFSLIHKGIGRVYGLCLGSDHHNPDGTFTGDKHKHSWTDGHRDRKAYVPQDITADVSNPSEVWQQFCAEAGIEHAGELRPPPPEQTTLI